MSFASYPPSPTPTSPPDQTGPTRRRPTVLATGTALLAGVLCLVLGLLAAGPASSVPQSVGAAAPTTYKGSLPSGATWSASVPEDWNGTILLFSHGFGALVPVESPPPPQTQDALLERGYALVGSSYSGPSMWALASAVNDQFGALAALQDRIGPGERVIGVGSSMGGLVSTLENERAEGRLDGVLTTCGIVAGGVALNDYQLDGGHALTSLLAPRADIRLVRYPDAASAERAADQLVDVAEQASASAAGRARLVLAAALYNAPTWVAPASEPRRGDYAEQVRQQVSLMNGSAFPFLRFITTGRQQIELSAGGNSSGTVGVDYARRLDGTGYLPLVRYAYRQAGLSLRADLARLTRSADITADRAARKRLTRSSQPTGQLTVPQLDLHTVADELVPTQHLSVLRAAVRRAGKAAWHRQALTRTSGHCRFTVDELVTSLGALEERLDTGRWPRTDAGALTRRARAEGLTRTAFVDRRVGPLGGVRGSARVPR